MSTKINNSFWKCKIFSSFYEGIKSVSIYGLLRFMAICAIPFLTSTIFQSLRLRLEEGEAQVFAAGLAVEPGLFADGGRSAAAFAPDLEGVGGAEVEGVFAVFAGEGIDRLVELPDLLLPDQAAPGYHSMRVAACSAMMANSAALKNISWE